MEVWHESYGKSFLGFLKAYTACYDVLSELLGTALVSQTFPN